MSEKIVENLCDTFYFPKTWNLMCQDDSTRIFVEE